MILNVMSAFKRTFLALLIFLFFSNVVSGQLREIYNGSNVNNHIIGISFATPSTGFAAFTNYIGFTSDSGHSFTPRYISDANTTGQYTYGISMLTFSAAGIKALSQDSLFVFGDAALAPTILFSANGGLSWRIVYSTPWNPNAPVFNQGITDMEFPGNSNTGFAIYHEAILRTTNRGQSWSVCFPAWNQQLYQLSFPSPSIGYAAGGDNLYKTVNAGITWTALNLPAGNQNGVGTVDFITDNIGYATASVGKIYKTTTGGSSWTLMNDPELITVGGDIRFVNDSTGFMFGLGYNVMKTSDNGVTWETCKKNTNYEYEFSGMNAWDFYSSQIAWFGGTKEYLLITTNGASPTKPAAYFKIDTAGLGLTGLVHLDNHSKPTYGYKWFVNNTLVSTSYNATYTHNSSSPLDSVTLIVTNGIDSDTSTLYHYFWVAPPPVTITGWVDKPTNINDDLMDVRFLANKGTVIGRKGIYYTSTGADDPNGWHLYKITGASSDSLQLVHTKFSHVAFDNINPSFYACGTDTINHKAILFKLNLSTLTYSFLYTGAPGSSFNDIFVEGNLIYCVGANGLFVSYELAQSQAYPTILAGSNNLVRVFRNANSYVNSLNVFADSTVYIGSYSNHTFVTSFSKQLKQKIVAGTTEPIGFLGISSNKLYLYSLQSGVLKVDSVNHFKPQTVQFKNIGSPYPADKAFIATDHGIYRFFRSGAVSSYVIEQQPTSLQRDFNGIWFMQTSPYDTGYAVGQNGVLMQTTNFGGPAIPYSEILNVGNCIGSPTVFYGYHGSGDGCRWYVDDAFITNDCGTPSTTINSPGTHTIKYIVSNGVGLADTSIKNIYISPLPNINLPVSISDAILCKSESITVTVQSTQAGFRYELVDSTGGRYGSANSSSDGSQVSFVTLPISRTGNYFIRVTNILGGCVRDFTVTIPIFVEHTRSLFTANRINAATGESIGFYAHSLEAQSYSWIFNQDASTSSSVVANPQNIFYGSNGQKTLTLISTSSNGCSDTLTSNAVFVYTKPVPADVCYAANIDSGMTAGQGYRNMSPTSGGDYFIAGSNGNAPLIRSRYGLSKRLPVNAVTFLARYSTDGVLRWVDYAGSGAIMTTATDDDGNVYVGGYCNILSYFYFNNGDSIRISATASDLSSTGDKYNGFIIKIDSNGKYLWHTILDGLGSSQGGLVKRIHVKGNAVVISGSFLANLRYYRNGTTQSLYAFTNTGYPQDNQNEFLLKIHDDGSLVWNTYADNDANNYIYGIGDVKMDNNKNVYFSGWHEGQFTFYDAANHTIQYPGTTGSQHGYLIKLDSAGRIIWKVHADNNNFSNQVGLSSLAIDDFGNAYVTGSCDTLQNSQHFVLTNSNGSAVNLSFSTYFLLKIDSSGIYRWGAGSRHAFYGGGSTVYLKNGSVYTTGKLSVRFTYTGQYNMISSDSTSIYFPMYNTEFFVARYDTSGILTQLSKSGQLPGNVVTESTVGDFFIDNDENIVIAGSVSGTTAPNVFGITYGAPQGGDVFFAKLKPNLCLNAPAPFADAGADRTVCSGNNTILGGTPVNGFSYNWNSRPAGFTSTLPNPGVAPNVTTTYYLSVLNAAGFISRDTVVVSVSGPIADAGTDRTICAGNPTTIGVAEVNGLTYSWSSNPAGFTSTISSPVVNPSVTTSYFLTVTNASSSCIAKDTVVVTANPLPPQFGGPDKTICSGSPVGTIIGLVPVPIFSYLWTPSTGLSSATVAQPFANPSVTTTYILRITNNQTSCFSYDTVTVNVVQANVSPTITPAGPASICSGGNITLTASSTTGNQWYKDGTAISGATAQTYNATQAGSYTVKYSTSSCSSDMSAPVVVTVTAGLPTPTITASGPTSFCSGANVVLNSSSAASYQWYKDGTMIAGATNQSFTATQSGNYTVKVGSGTCTATSSIVTVIVTATPVTPSITPSGNQSYCQGTPIILTSSHPLAGNQWYKDGVAIPGANSLNIAVNQPGSYTTIVTIGGCSSASSAPTVITINPLPPQPVITPAGPTTFCTGGSVVLSSPTAAGYQWYRDGVAISGATAQTFTATTNGTYSLKISNGLCESVATNLITVIVSNPPATPTITAGSATTFCQGGSVVLTSNASSGNQWYKDGVAIGGAINSTLTVSQGGNYTVISSVNGCNSNPSTAILVTVNTAPATPVITASGAVNFCTGGSVTLTSSANTSNQWYKDGTAISGAVASTLVVNTTGNYTAKTSTGSCQSGASNTIAVTVSSAPAAPVVTAGGSTSFCQGGNVVLTSSVGSGIQWYNGSTLLAGATSQNYTATQAGTYSAVLTVNGCSPVSSNSVAVTVTPLPPAPTIVIIANILLSSAATGNQWYKDGVLIPGATNGSYQPVASGVYTVRITVNGCTSAPSNAINFVATAINSVVLNNQIILMPNPVSDVLYIRYSGSNGTFKMRLMSMDGKEISRGTFNSNTSLYMKTYAAGVYVLEITNTRTGEHVQRMVVKI